MLRNHSAIATIAVKDIDAAKKFYADTLGLEALPVNGPGVLSFKCGDSKFFVYQSLDARTNKATAATWVVGIDIKPIVDALKTRGVKFEHYDYPNTTLDGDIHVTGAMKVAWFKDPDENILALVNQ